MDVMDSVDSTTRVLAMKPNRLAKPRAEAALPASATIFHEEWWLDAACPGRWGRAEIAWDGKRVGCLPYAIERRHGTTRLVMPKYTRVLGPVLTLPPSKPVTWNANACAVVADLVGHLPRHDSFKQYLAPEAGTAFAFLQQGWTVAHSYTFQFARGTDAAVAWADMDQKTRNVVRGARKRLVVEQHADLGRFVTLARKQFARQGQRDGHDYAALERLAGASLDHERAVILAARDGVKDAASAILLWDAATLYLWNAARDVEIAGNAAFSFLVWEALSFALGRGLTFDFDGFASPSSAAFLLSFGGEPKVRPVILRRGIVTKAYEAAKDIGGRLSAGSRRVGIRQPARATRPA